VPDAEADMGMNSNTLTPHFNVDGPRIPAKRGRQEEQHVPNDTIMDASHSQPKWLHVHDPLIPSTMSPVA
jgi:hypothetical protein